MCPSKLWLGHRATYGKKAAKRKSWRRREGKGRKMLRLKKSLALTCAQISPISISFLCPLDLPHFSSQPAYKHNHILAILHAITIFRLGAGNCDLYLRRSGFFRANSSALPPLTLERKPTWTQQQALKKPGEASKVLWLYLLRNLPRSSSQSNLSLHQKPQWHLLRKAAGQWSMWMLLQFPWSWSISTVHQKAQENEGWQNCYSTTSPSLTTSIYITAITHATYNRGTVRTSQQVIFEHQSSVESLI